MKKHANKQTKKGLVLLLCALMLTPSIVSCSESSVNTNDETKADTTQTPSQTSTESESVDDETKELQPNIPKLDFEGTTFTFLTSGANDSNGVDWETYDVWAETINGEPINDAVYERNEYINETYNVSIAEYKTAKDTLSEIKQEVQASTGTFQAAFTHFQNGATLSQQGALLDLLQMPYIDVSQPWWDQRAAEDLEVMGKLYQATGDATVIDNDATWVLFFNKQMREDLQMEDLYTLVREDRWYYDTLYAMIQAAAMDVNADGKISYKDDRLGFITSDASCYGLLYASGLQLVMPDKDEVFTFTDEIEKLTSVVEKAGKIISDKNTTHLTGDEGSTSITIRVAFEEGRGLFYGEVMQCATRMRASETDFGLIPWPKFDETQDSYYNWIHSSAGRGLVIPISVPQADYEMVGAIVEAYAAKSMYTLTEAYYDKSFTYKSLRDEDSIEMLEIVLQSRMYSLGDIYSLGLDSGITTLIKNGSTDVASTWTRSSKVASKILDKAIKNLEKYIG
ncbi:MAG: hypothetical protein ACI4XJ_06125 [Eubacteriales bacterium]